MVPADVLLGHGHEASHFLRRDHLGGIAKSAIGLGLHFYKYYRGAVLRDEVQFTEAGTIAPNEYLIPESLKFEGGDCLAFEAETLTLKGHG